MRMKLSDAKESSDKHRVERDSLRNELDKLHEQVRSLKDDAAGKYESYSKQLNQAESLTEEKIRSVNNENERLKDENNTLRKNL